MKKLILFLMLFNCGEEPVTESNEAEYNNFVAKESRNYDYALKVETEADLPECSDENSKQLVYVVETDVFSSCEKRKWVAIEIRGKNGRNGKDGQDGENGIDGENGNDALTSIAINPDGSVLGRLVYLNESTNEFFVLTSTGLRMQFSQTSGHFKNAYILFSGADCTGTSRILLTNGYWGNTFVDGRDNETTYKLTGQNLGSFNYASRVPAASNCQNSVGTALRTYNYEQITLPRYPLTNVDMEN